jgi:hypothetical protein
VPDVLPWYLIHLQNLSKTAAKRWGAFALNSMVMFMLYRESTNFPFVLFYMAIQDGDLYLAESTVYDLGSL